MSQVCGELCSRKNTQMKHTFDNSVIVLCGETSEQGEERDPRCNQEEQVIRSKYIGRHLPAFYIVKVEGDKLKS